MPKPARLLFLPGASGIPAFWHPLAGRLGFEAEYRFMAYPGFGEEPPDPTVTSLDDLAAHLVSQINCPTALIAQSMGGILAVRAAIEKPHLITHLVLSVTSGGIDMEAFRAHDWRPAFLAANPHLPDWFIADRSDLTSEIKRLLQPVLLLWGDADPISPLAVGRHLQSLLPRATLHVVKDGGHDLANTHAAELAALIDEHLQQST
ncbi:MAG TPA: alpha/beta fold hydrolase [Burkholderiaceae bacterium]